MTTKEAIDYLLNPIDTVLEHDLISKLKRHEEAVSMAIEALKAQEVKNSNQEVKNQNDLISRQAAIDEAEEWIEAVYCEYSEQRERDAVKHVIHSLKALPSVKPEPKPDKNGSELFGNTEKLGNRTTDDCIGRQAVCQHLRRTIESINAEDRDKYNEGFADGLEFCISTLATLPSVQPEPIWHECFEDDPSSFPDDDRNVLVSFSNFDLPIIGQWRADEDGVGCWHLGDTDETFLSENLYVDGWWELPRKPERR